MCRKMREFGSWVTSVLACEAAVYGLWQRLMRRQMLSRCYSRCLLPGVSCMMRAARSDGPIAAGTHPFCLYAGCSAQALCELGGVMLDVADIYQLVFELGYAIPAE